MDPSTSVKYINSALCISASLCIFRKETLAHINCDVTSRTFPFIHNEKGRTKTRNGRGLLLVSFWGETDREAVTRMSGRHQTTSLTNEGPCLVHWGNLSTFWTYGNKINLKFSWINGKVLNKRLKEIKIVELHVTSTWSVLILTGFELFIEMFTLVHPPS